MGSLVFTFSCKSFAVLILTIFYSSGTYQMYRNAIIYQDITKKDFAKCDRYFLAGNYMLKVNNRNTRTWCEICSKLTTKTTERHHWLRSGVFIVNLEHISHLVLIFLLLTLCR